MAQKEKNCKSSKSNFDNEKKLKKTEETVKKEEGNERKNPKKNHLKKV